METQDILAAAGQSAKRRLAHFGRILRVRQASCDRLEAAVSPYAAPAGRRQLLNISAPSCFMNL